MRGRDPLAGTADIAVFLDIEASSLDSGSFPIEIAWVDAAGQGEAHLICPQFNWKGWSSASEKIHGIPRSMLDTAGIPAVTVARRAYEALHSRIIYSDNAAFDAYWLEMLLNLIGHPALKIESFDKLRSAELSRLAEANGDLEAGRQYMAAIDALEAIRRPIQHRALPDADSLRRRWKAVKVWVDEKLGGQK